MKKLDNIINRLRSSFNLDGFSYAKNKFLATKAAVLGPCCEAAFVFSKDNPRIAQAASLIEDALKPGVTQDVQKNLYTQYLLLVSEATKTFIDNYCSCTSTTLSADTGEYDKPEGPCAAALEGFVKNKDASAAIKTLQIMKANDRQFSMDYLLSRPSFKQNFIVHWAKFMDDMQQKLPEFIATNRSSFNPLLNHALPTGSSYKDMKRFLGDLCKLKNSSLNGLNAYNLFRGKLVAGIELNGVSFMTFEDWYESISMSVSAAPNEVQCPPSANDNTIGALAAALGVSAAAVAVALAAIRRGKTKQCSDVAVTARNLAPLLIAATGASFATTQTSEATVQERLQAVLQKDCEGRLPYSCGEGGFEGSDDGDDSGEVDAPGGGGGGIGGG